MEIVSGLYSPESNETRFIAAEKPFVLHYQTKVGVTAIDKTKST